MQAATIKLFLAHGSPTRLRTAELSNWSGKAIAAPRTEFAELIKREELARTGVYLLTGVDPDSGSNTIYIGVAEKIANRLKSHLSKDFWNAVTVFTSKDENLTKSHVLYIEGILIEKALANRALIVKNATSSGAKLPESDTAEMDIFIEKCLQLLPVLGVSDFKSKIEPSSEPDDVLYCKIKGLSASGQRTENGFIVFAGSQAVSEHRPSAKNFKSQREALIESGTLKPQDNYWVFTEDAEFSSPSTAASVIQGGSMNGLTSWKNAKGIELKELEAKESA